MVANIDAHSPKRSDLWFSMMYLCLLDLPLCSSHIIFLRPGAGQRHPEEDRPWDQDARRGLQAAGRLLAERPGPRSSEEPSDLQHPHHGLHVGAAKDEGGPGHAESGTEVVGRRADGR